MAETERVVVRGWLLVNINGDMRTCKRLSTLKWDEVAFPVEVVLPHSYGRVYDDKTIKLELPGGKVDVAVGELVDIAQNLNDD